MIDVEHLSTNPDYQQLETRIYTWNSLGIAITKIVSVEMQRFVLLPQQSSNVKSITRNIHMNAVADYIWIIWRSLPL